MPTHDSTNAQTGAPPKAILAAWTALEALSPQTYRQPTDLINGVNRSVVQIADDRLPWLHAAPCKSGHETYYEIILGSILLSPCTNEFIKIFGQDEEPSWIKQGNAILATILVNQQGVLLPKDAVAVASFGWAFPIALKGDFAKLGEWIQIEASLVDGLSNQFAQTDEWGNPGNPVPLDAPALWRAYQWLVTTLELPVNLHEGPSFALRICHSSKSKKPPEVSLLNSFFLADLGRASRLLSTGHPGRALSQYMGEQQVPHSPNLLKNHALIEELLAPAQTPAARWPSPDGHALVTLQQAAVNAVRGELTDAGAGLVAVNGPPGTGKTTLLRDVVAACVLDRAIAMAKFDDPATGFRKAGPKTNDYLNIYQLDESLKGHEIWVASSNNKAVENISKELPTLKSIGCDLTYFKSISDNLQSESTPTWGLIAAVLGNAENRGNFQNAVWWDDDKSLRQYLKAARGEMVFRAIKDHTGRIIGREVPTIIKAESPPSPQQAKVNWQKARAHFTALRTEVEATLRELESVRQTCLKLAPSREAVRLAQGAWDDAIAVQTKQAQTLADTLKMRETTRAAVTTAKQPAQEALAQRPGWLHRLFNTRRMRNWHEIYTALTCALTDAEAQEKAAISAHENAEDQYQRAQAAVRSSHDQLARTQTALASVEQAIEQERLRLGSRLVDEQFFQQGHEQWNLATPWLPDALQQQRAALFASALQLHRAFIDASAHYVLNNLGSLMDAMQAGAAQGNARALLGDLWSTLFLVCPVVSTTFASVDRMLGDLPRSSFGWALIDEAGQATPQSAVGLLMRAQKAIIVGDPLQIPPVVTLPKRLVNEVAQHFGVNANQWLAPEASVQTLADQASRLQAEFRTDVGVRKVGLPLLVHRRCQQPMFGISNRIAYDGQMVHAIRGPATGAIVQALGDSGWLDVDGNAPDKWSPAEGDMVVSLLLRLAAAGIRKPDIYVITPFRRVAYELRRRIKREPGLLQRMGIDSDHWLSERVGTIHTFQGKEAQAVIAVLGAPMATQQGARRWAASTPNIFNVMVSRAQQSLYIVGSRTAWSAVGHGNTMASALPNK